MNSRTKYIIRNHNADTLYAKMMVLLRREGCDVGLASEMARAASEVYREKAVIELNAKGGDVAPPLKP